MDTAEVLNCLKKQATSFGNPKRIISDRGIAFTSEDFEEYCRNESIKHILKTTEVLRVNEQLKRINQIIVPFLAAKSEEWLKYLSVVQRYLNTKIDQNTMTTPHDLLFGVHPRYPEDDKLQKLLEYEGVILFQKNRDKLRMQAAKSIAKLQEENWWRFNKKQKEAQPYREGDLVAVKRTQQDPGSKFAFIGPYEIVKVLRNNRYLVQKVGEHEGPQRTSSAADFMKP